jgi:DNA-binding NtrC family response regulator
MARILIIDDSEVMREMLSEFLKDAGHHVYSTGDHDDGIARSMQETFDVCICDMHLTCIDGFQVVQSLSQYHSDMRFIVTDSLPDEYSQKVLQHKEFMYIRKPFELDQIRSLLEKAMNTPRERNVT